jgi:hypothetical protein
MKHFINEVRTNGGGSIHIPSGYVNPTRGYMVSLKGFEKKLQDSLDMAVVIDYVDSEINSTGLLYNHHTYLGIWLKEGTWYLDVSINMDDEESAIAFGKANEQIAIWDCAKGDEIVLDYDTHKYTHNYIISGGEPIEEDIDLYPRKCSVTGKGMSEGWCLFGGDEYASDEASARKLAIEYGYDDLGYDLTYNDDFYWTEWETEMNPDDNDEMWDAEGNLYTWVDGKPTRYVEPTPEVIDLRKNVRSHQYAVTFTREYTTTINVSSEDEASAIVMAHDTLAEQEMEQMNVDTTNIIVKKRFNLAKG